MVSGTSRSTTVVTPTSIGWLAVPAAAGSAASAGVAVRPQPIVAVDARSRASRDAASAGEKRLVTMNSGYRRSGAERRKAEPFQDVVGVGLDHVVAERHAVVRQERLDEAVIDGHGENGADQRFGIAGAESA